ncbi:MAG: RNA polymerase sigma factor [Flavobacteriaceae bacterium]|nr:RNA polymerase sigma factor [Flavobacteriaceae bacterium]
MSKEELQNNIIKARTGNQNAYKYLLNAFWVSVYNFLLNKTKNEDEAEDITIKTFAKAFDKLTIYNEGYAFKTWLITISKNIYIDHLRQQKAETISIHKDDNSIFDIQDSTPSIEDKIITAQNLTQLLSYIKKLKPHYQEIIQLRYFQEMTYKEITQELSEPMNNVKVKLLRARKLLAEIIRNSNFKK